MSEDEEQAEPWVWPISLEAVRSWLRLGAMSDEDALLTGLIASATALCEAFIGQVICVRDAEWRGQMVAGGLAMALPLRPVVAVDEVALLDEFGDEELMDSASYGVVIDRHGVARVRLVAGQGVSPLVVRYRVGMAAGPIAVPEALRHGILRMVQHLYEARDGESALGPLAAVAALWQPWRQVTLGGRI